MQHLSHPTQLLRIDAGQNCITDIHVHYQIIRLIGIRRFCNKTREADQLAIWTKQGTGDQVDVALSSARTPMKFPLFLGKIHPNGAEIHMFLCFTMIHLAFSHGKIPPLCRGEEKRRPPRRASAAAPAWARRRGSAAELAGALHRSLKGEKVGKLWPFTSYRMYRMYRMHMQCIECIECIVIEL